MKESLAALHFLWNDPAFINSLAGCVLRRDNSGTAIRIYPIQTTRFSKDEAAIVAS